MLEAQLHQLSLNHWSIPSDPRTNGLHNKLTFSIYNEQCIKPCTVDSDYFKTSLIEIVSILVYPTHQVFNVANNL